MTETKLLSKFPPHPECVIEKKCLFSWIHRAEKARDEWINNLIQNAQIHEMTREEIEEDFWFCLVDHFCTIYAYGLIDEARQAGKNRFACKITVDDIAEWLQNVPLSHGKLREAIEDSLNDDEEKGLIEKTDTFPFERYAPTKINFDTIVEHFNAGKGIKLETYLGRLYVWRSGHEEIGEDMQLFRTYLVFWGEDLLWATEEEYSKIKKLDAVVMKKLEEVRVKHEQKRKETKEETS